MTATRASSLLAASVVCLVAGLATSSALGQTLQSQVNRLVSNAKLGTARVGISVIDVRSGEVLAARQADEAFIPASNMKVLTAGAALWTLGPEYSFRTELVLDGDRLTVVGSGDPAFGDPEILQKNEPKLTVSGLLDSLTDAVVKTGVRSLSEVVIDDRVFDRDAVHPTWPTDQLDRWYCAEVSGLNFHTNVLDVFARPGAGPGARPSASFEPATGTVEMDVSRAKTVSTGSNSVWFRREPKTNSFSMLGDVRFALTRPVQVTITQPPLFFGRILGERLERAGVHPATGPLNVRLVEPGEPRAAGRTVALVKTSMKDVLRRCNADSHNLYAEALLKRVGNEVTGQPGSWENGAAVVRMLVSEKIGPDAVRELVVRDGSGMSRQNRVSPATVTAWLAGLARDSTVSEAFIESLPKPGSGTLERRFRGLQPRHVVHAKSGYIRNVRCLSGYVIDEADGEKIAFSILANEVPGGEEDAAALRLHEQIVAEIDRYLSRNDPQEKPSESGAGASRGSGRRGR